MIVRAKGYADMEPHVAPWTGDTEFAAIVEAIETRAGQRAPPTPLEDVAVPAVDGGVVADSDAVTKTTHEHDSETRTSEAQDTERRTVDLSMPGTLLAHEALAPHAVQLVQ